MQAQNIQSARMALYFYLLIFVGLLSVIGWTRLLWLARKSGSDRLRILAFGLIPPLITLNAVLWIVYLLVN